MRTILFLCLACATALASPDRKPINSYLYGSGDEKSAIAALDASPDLAKDPELFGSLLRDSGIRGALGEHSTRLAEAMIARGADVDGKRDDMPLVVHFAMFAQVAPLKLLVAHKAKLDAVDDDGRTALHWLATGVQNDQTIAAAKLLLDAKATVDVKDKRGATALHIAAFVGAKALTELLLARGADIDAVDARGYSVLAACKLRVEPHKDAPNGFASAAEKAATRKVIDLLVKKGAKDIHPN